MRGLQLHKRFAEEWCLPFLRDHFTELEDRVALAATGGGSDVYGYDDDVSRSHKWFPRCLFLLTETDRHQYGDELQATLTNHLPPQFAGVETLAATTWGPEEHPSPVGSAVVMSTPAFFNLMTGHPSAPSDPISWLAIPECDLYHATNGRVFHDPLGEFSERRETFADYPEPVWWRRLCQQLTILDVDIMYNLGRCLPRQDGVTAFIWTGKGIRALLRIAFLVNHRYAPYDKWLYTAFKDLPVLSQEIDPLVCQIVEEPHCHERYQLFMSAVRVVVEYLIDEGILPNRKLSEGMGVHGCSMLKPILKEVADRIPAALRTMPIAEESKVFS